jgi:glucose/arabinose dehydrogenase
LDESRFTSTVKIVTLIALLVTLAACTSQPQAAVPTSTTSTPTPAEIASPPAGSAEPVENGMKYTVNTGFGSDGLMLEIKQVWVMPEGLKMSVSIHNEAEVPVEFHPDQGSRVVVSGRQLESDPLATQGDIGGNYQPGEKRTGEILFPVSSEAPLDVDQVDRVRLYLDDVVIGDILSKNGQMELKLK